jgi:hypothetical protein
MRWVLKWALTPIALVVHLVLWAVGYPCCALLRVCGARVPLPRFPQFWRAAYWRMLADRVSFVGNIVVAVGDLFN